MSKKITAIVNKYAEGIEHVERRREDWLQKAKEVKSVLKRIAEELETEAKYKPGFHVDELHAYDDEINGTCVKMPSITFKCGNMSMGITFNNSVNGEKEYVEKGFMIGFYPAITGLVYVMLYLHKNDFQAQATPPVNLMVINEPKDLSESAIENIVAQGVEIAFHSSYAGISEQSEEPEYTPIGFRKRDSTEH
jgi:hypothetical protein